MHKPLFRISDIAPVEEKGIQAELLEDADGTSESLFCKSSETLERLFPSLKPNCTTHFVCPGKWAMHELLLHLLELTGPGRVFFTTWGISEHPVRLLIDAMAQGKILELHAILDARVKMRTPQVFHLANEQFSHVRLYDCHAKVVVIENETWSLAVVGSSNMTNNPRIEAGTLCTVPSIAQFHKNWILEVIEKSHPFE